MTCRCSGGHGIPKAYHVEYAYSCMGYEIAAGVGAKMAAPEREVVVLVGDGSYLMLSSEITTMVSEGLKVIIVIVQNHGFASIGALSESLGSQRFGTAVPLQGRRSPACSTATRSRSTWPRTPRASAPR